jgi:hypothetical protein
VLKFFINFYLNLNSMKKYTLLLLLLISCITCLQAQWIQIGADIDGESINDLSGESVSLNADGSIIAIGAKRNEGNGTFAGHVRIYENINGNWVQVGNDIDSESANDGSGASVSLSDNGSILAIGATGNDGGGMASGHVRVFKNQSGNWVQIGNDIDGESEFNSFGISISLNSNGTILAVGASRNDGNGIDSGHVRVFRNQNGNWLQIGNDIDGEAVGDFFGRTVDLSSDGSILAAGAPFNDGNGADSGHVRVFQNQNGNWLQIGNDIDGEAAGDNFNAVSLNADGSILAVGAQSNDGNGIASGHVRVFENINNVWSQIGNDINGEAQFDNSGRPEEVKLNADGSIVAIGAIGNSGNGASSGHVRVFQNQNGNWTQIGIDINGEAQDDFSGDAISLSADGSVLAVGAPNNGGNGVASGHVRVFKNDNLLSVVGNKNSTLSFYPNPTQGIIYINQRIIYKVEAFDIMGRNLGLIHHQNNEIDLSGKKRGVYLLRIYTDKGVANIKAILIE